MRSMTHNFSQTTKHMEQLRIELKQATDSLISLTKRLEREGDTVIIAHLMKVESEKVTGIMQRMNRKLVLNKIGA